MNSVVGEVTTEGPSTTPVLVQAIRNAIENAPPLPPGMDVRHFELLEIEFEHGGLVGFTRTRVTFDAEPGPLPDGSNNTRQR